MLTMFAREFNLMGMDGPWLKKLNHLTTYWPLLMAQAALLGLDHRLSGLQTQHPSMPMDGTSLFWMLRR